MSTQPKEVDILDPVSTKLDKKHPSSKKSCKCSKCRKKCKQQIHICSQCTKECPSDQEKVKCKREPQNIFITFLT